MLLVPQPQRDKDLQVGNMAGKATKMPLGESIMQRITNNHGPVLPCQFFLHDFASWSGMEWQRSQEQPSAHTVGSTLDETPAAFVITPI